MIDAKIFMQILNDKNFYNLKNLKCKYGREKINEVITLLKNSVYKKINLLDFNNQKLVFCPPLINIADDAYKYLLFKETDYHYNISKMEQEIEGTLEIENIESSRNSIRNILKGHAPTNLNESKIYGIKKGLDFISNKDNKITEINLNLLYNIVMANNLESNEKLINNNFYRHDSVYVIGNEISHKGLDYKLLPQYMQNFIAFINLNDKINIIIKSIIIHFYFAYIHPYFNGNGRMARLLQLWYLIQNNFNSTLLVPFSKFISKTKNEYYKAFDVIEKNYETSKVIDVTPFILYFNENVFDNLKYEKNNNNVIEIFNEHLNKGEITSKEKELFIFVLCNYSNNEFSTKQLEKDYKNVAYATIRSFVIKFESFGILTSQKYSNRIKYKINNI